MESSTFNLNEFLQQASVEELKRIVEEASAELKRRSGKTYYEIRISSNPYKGSGKCWIQRIVDGVRADFVDPVSTEMDRYCKTRIYRLSPGIYLVNEEGTKSYDRRYKIEVLPDFTAVNLG